MWRLGLSLSQASVFVNLRLGRTGALVGALLAGILLILVFASHLATNTRFARQSSTASDLC